MADKRFTAWLVDWFSNLCTSWHGFLCAAAAWLAWVTVVDAAALQFAISLWSTASLSFLFDVGKDDWTNQRMPHVEALFQDTVVDLALVTRALRQLDKDFQPAAIPGGVAQKDLWQCHYFGVSTKKLAQEHAAQGGLGCAWAADTAELRLGARKVCACGSSDQYSTLCRCQCRLRQAHSPGPSLCSAGACG